MSTIDKLLSKHHDLDFAIRDRRGRVFYSDWDCEHPFVNEYLNGMPVDLSPESDVHKYRFFEDEHGVISSISKFHAKVEGHSYDNDTLVAGDGSTSLISAYCIWLLDQSVTELLYVPPMYYNLYYFTQVLGIKVRPVAAVHPFEDGFSLKLPDRKSYLVLTDPAWYAGISVQEDVVEQIRVWQQKTGSEVFVDGSFQYTRWDGTLREATARLDPDLTMRLICPSKTVALHGFRFSYLLLPKRCRNDIRYIYANTHGPTAAHNTRFAQHVMDLLGSDDSNGKLTSYIGSCYKSLIDKRVLRSAFEPDCGYFVFAKLTSDAGPEKRILMDGDFFEQPRHKSYYRINLLAPDTQKHLLNLNG
jgi:aspartate/methionine/tyrosine aminotransferase